MGIAIRVVICYNKKAVYLNEQVSSLLKRNYHRNRYREVKIMQEAIQPKYYQAKVTCNCGNEFVTGSTKPEIHVEVCSKCHSFYTGQQKAAAARGAIDKFNRKYGLNN